MLKVKREKRESKRKQAYSRFGHEDKNCNKVKRRRQGYKQHIRAHRKREAEHIQQDITKRENLKPCKPVHNFDQERIYKEASACITYTSQAT